MDSLPLPGTEKNGGFIKASETEIGGIYYVVGILMLRVSCPYEMRNPAKQALPFWFLSGDNILFEYGPDYGGFKPAGFRLLNFQPIKQFLR